MTTLNAPHDFVPALIRRGLPADYAERTAAELADHRVDLVNELRAAGMSDAQAVAEAAQRLGDSRTLVKKTVREYQRRHLCGRWPLLTFLIGPIPTCISIWILTALLFATLGYLIGDYSEATDRIETTAQFAIAYALKIWLTFGTPLLVVVGFCWLSARASLGRAWPCLASGGLALFVGFAECVIYHGTAQHPSGRMLMNYPLWFPPEYGRLQFLWENQWQLAQLMMPLAATALVLLWGLHRSRRRSQVPFGGC